MGFFRGAGDQRADGAFSEDHPDLPEGLLPVAGWATALRSSLIDEIPEEVAVLQIGLVAEAARIAAESRRSPAAAAITPGWREYLHLSQVPLRLAAQAAVVLVALVGLAGGVAAAVGVDVPALITRPFHSPASTTLHGTAPGHEGPAGPDLSSTSTSSLPDVSTTVVDEDGDSTAGTSGPVGTTDGTSSLDDDEAEEPVGPDEATDDEAEEPVEPDEATDDEAEEPVGPDEAAEEAEDDAAEAADEAEDAADEAADEAEEAAELP